MRIFIAGDSTAANKTDAVYPETGWGQVLAQALQEVQAQQEVSAQAPGAVGAAGAVGAPGAGAADATALAGRPGLEDVAVHNHAVNGRSTRSFTTEGRLAQLCDELEPGDLVLVQFGHNDQKLADPDRGTHPDGSYRHYLRHFAARIRERGAQPIFLTSITRRAWILQGGPAILDPHTLGDYPAAMQQLGGELGIPVLDIFTATQQLVQRLGPEDSADLYLHFAPGEQPNYPDGVSDDTHLSVFGATQVARIVAGQLYPLLPIAGAP